MQELAGERLAIRQLRDGVQRKKRLRNACTQGEEKKKTVSAQNGGTGTELISCLIRSALTVKNQAGIGSRNMAEQRGETEGAQILIRAITMGFPQ